MTASVRVVEAPSPKGTPRVIAPGAGERARVTRVPVSGSPLAFALDGPLRQYLLDVYADFSRGDAHYPILVEVGE